MKIHGYEIIKVLEVRTDSLIFVTDVKGLCFYINYGCKDNTTKIGVWRGKAFFDNRYNNELREEPIFKDIVDRSIKRIFEKLETKNYEDEKFFDRKIKHFEEIGYETPKKEWKEADFYKKYL